MRPAAPAGSHATAWAAPPPRHGPDRRGLPGRRYAPAVLLGWGRPAGGPTGRRDAPRRTAMCRQSRSRRLVDCPCGASPLPLLESRSGPVGMPTPSPGTSSGTALPHCAPPIPARRPATGARNLAGRARHLERYPMIGTGIGLVSPHLYRRFCSSLRDLGISSRQPKRSMISIVFSTARSA